MARRKNLVVLVSEKEEQARDQVIIVAKLWAKCMRSAGLPLYGKTLMEAVDRLEKLEKK
jgi:hypothetical protein